MAEQDITPDKENGRKPPSSPSDIRNALSPRLIKALKICGLCGVIAVPVFGGSSLFGLARLLPIKGSTHICWPEEECPEIVRGYHRMELVGKWAYFGG